jgi:hypothetical protein
METMMSINWKIVWQSRWLIMLAFVLAAVISATSFFLVPQQWAAIAFIKVGHVDLVTHGSGNENATLLRVPVESTVGMANEMLTPAFIESAAKAAGLSRDAINLIPEEYRGHGRLDITAMKHNIILLRLRADSREDAQKLAQAFVGIICDKQLKVVTPMIINKTRKIDAMRHDLITIQSFSTELHNKSELIGQARNEAGIPAAVNWRLAAIQSSVYLQSKIANTKQELLFPFMVKTKALNGVSTLPRPVLPRPSVFVGLGILLWLMMSAIIVIWPKKSSRDQRLIRSSE